MLLALAPVTLASIEVALGLLAVMLSPDGACENALPKGARIVLIDITSSNADADTTVASVMLTFIKVLDAARVITVILKR